MDRRYRPYPQYKDSGVEWLGEIPAHWEVRRLKFVAIVNPSKSEVSQLPDDLEVSFLPMERVGSGSLDLELTKALGEIKQGFTYFRNGDVLVAKITPSFENGKGSLAFGLENGIGFGTTELHVIRAASEIDRQFLFYLTFSHQFRGMGETQMYGTAGQKRVPDWFINNFPTPLPPLPEQRTIAAFLDRETARIDALIAKKRELIALLRRQRTAVISHAVTKGLDPNAPLKDSGVEWLGEIPAHWEAWKVSHIFRRIGSGATPPTNQQEYYEGDVNWVTTSELRDNEISDTQKKITREALQKFSALKLYPPGTLLIALYGATIGRIGLLTVEATTNQACCALVEPRNMITKFGFYCLYASRDWVVNLGYGGGQPNISQEIIRKLKLPLPPLPEQRTIAAYLDRETARIDRLVTEIEASIDLLQRQRTALISAAVTGKIDIREQQQLDKTNALLGTPSRGG